MLIFIDESGDPGMKQGSSPFFVVTLVAFEDHDDALSCDFHIQELKKQFCFSFHFEFHFNKLSRHFRELFFKSVISHNFFYFSIVINKQKLFGAGFEHPDSFYKYACGLVFENAKPYLKDAVVVIDGSGSRQFREGLSNYLRKRINNKNNAGALIKKVKLQDSKKNNLLQLADMICGAVARSFSDKTDSKLYRSIVSHREIYVQFWPRK